MKKGEQFPVRLIRNSKFKTRKLVAIVFRLVRAFDRHAKIFSLRFRQLGQHHADFFQMQAGHLFVKLL